jgi:hypothetical protein
MLIPMLTHARIATFPAEQIEHPPVYEKTERAVQSSLCRRACRQVESRRAEAEKNRVTSVSSRNQASYSEPSGMTTTSPGPQTRCSVPRRNSITRNPPLSAAGLPTHWSRLLARNAGGIVGCMPLSRTQPIPDLFGAVADHEPDRGPARLTSIRPTPVVMSTADKLSRRYVLPGDLSNALRQLDDFELDRLVAASRHELQRRGRPMTPAPISPGEPTSKPSIAKDPLPERQQLPEPKGTLTQGQVNAVLATFKAGIPPSRIARQFGISQSDVRKVLASEPRRPGKGR